jgi:hypothetical protein
MVLGRNELYYQEGCDTVCRQRATLQLVSVLLRQGQCARISNGRPVFQSPMFLVPRGLTDSVYRYVGRVVLLCTRKYVPAQNYNASRFYCVTS